MVLAGQPCLTEERLPPDNLKQNPFRRPWVAGLFSARLSAPTMAKPVKERIIIFEGISPFLCTECFINRFKFV